MSQQSINKNEQKGEVQYLFVGHKAGLDKVDTNRITKIINETTQTSEFYKRQQMKREQYDERIQEMKTIIDQTKSDPIKLLKTKQECDEKLEQLHQLIQTDRVWVHFDMDMFFVACELKDRPELKDLPVAVGGLSMISTANYVARKFGVRSAMPGFIAKKLCPQLILIPCNFEKYRKASEQFKQVLYHYDPNLESMGLDEANLDLTDYLQQNDINTDAQIYDLCHQIRKQVNESTGGLTCSCGIGPNKMLAKICSDVNKPNGQFQLQNDEQKVKDFMKSLPIRKIPGIGNVTEQILKGIGIEYCNQILDRIIDLRICFRELSFDHLVSSALGIGRSQHEEETEKKSISVSRTFPQISTIEEINEKIHQISVMLSEDAKAEQKVGKHLAVSFKNIKFQTRSKNRMIGRYIQDSETIEKIAKELVKELLPTEPLRLIGIRLSQLADEDEIKNQGLNKYFSKADKSNNQSMVQSSKKNSKQSKNTTQHSIQNIFQKNQQQNDKSMISESSNNQKIFDFQQSTDNSISFPFQADLSHTSQMIECGGVSNQQSIASKHIQPSFLSIIDKYESEGDQNDLLDSDSEEKEINLSKTNLPKKIYQSTQINDFTDEGSQDEDDEVVRKEYKVNKKDDYQNEEEEDNNDDDNEDDEDDLLYLKKILNKNISDRLSQISEKKSQEELRQSLSEKNNSMTPQFVFQNGLSQIQRFSASQDKNKQMIPENPQQFISFQSQQAQQTQYFQRKSEIEQQASNQSFEFMNMMISGESSKIEIINKRSPLKPKMIQEKENSSSIYVYDEYAEQMSQQYQYSLSQSSNKKRVPVDALTSEQIEEQLKLKKKFIPRLFECPICFQQLDSYGNATFVNTHITNCMKIQEDKFNQIENNNTQQNNNQNAQNPVSILNNFNSKQPTKRKMSDNRQRKSGQKKNSGTKHTLDSFIIKQKQ